MSDTGATKPGGSVTVAYADPPYPGQSWRLYGGHKDYAGEVDHAKLILQMERDYPDGWALSTSASALPEVLALCPYERGTDRKNPGRVEPERSVRVCAWIKPQAPWRPVGVQFGWEPLIVRGGRPRDPRDTLRDWLRCVPGPTEVTGAKPTIFCHWLFRLLGLEPQDELVDLFPGSGAVSRAWDAWRAQGVLDVA